MFVLMLLQAALGCMDRSALVRVLHGLTKMGLSPDNSWLACFYDRAESASGAFQVSGFGMVVWALAKVGAKPHPAWMACQLNGTYGWADSTDTTSSSSSRDGDLDSDQDDTASDAAERSVSNPQQQHVKPQHLANMLCAFAKLGFTPGGRWMAWFRAELDRTSAGGQLQELDHFHIEWAWRELNTQYRTAAVAAAAGSSSGSSGGASGSSGGASGSSSVAGGGSDNSGGEGGDMVE
jgi:hypothetical protein